MISTLPFIVLVILWFYLMRQAQGGMGGGGRIFSFGRSKARLLKQEDAQHRVTFADVAGVDEAKDELKEVVEFLSNPKKFTRLGARIPKGVLLVGPPGTGKTLLARAVAGEAGAPFFSISGSDFVEMFVGVGASRVRDLFEQGKKNAPCIIFIDEIDAVGRKRGAGLGGGHDEREQTLNQLLVEMDGFEANEGVILIAATNRPDVLDPALLRPGRFDRQVVVSTPDKAGRVQILLVHTKKIPLDRDVNVETLAAGTPGFSGADLENLVNEAALQAARQNKDMVTMAEFEFAKDKILMGRERRSMVLSDEQKRITAYHEGGHALAAKLLPKADPVHKVSIIPRGRALGITMQLPEEDRHGYSKTFLRNMLVMLLGGRVAEEIIFKNVTTGASNDIERVTSIARKMVCQWGMNDAIGTVCIGETGQEVFIGREWVQNKNYSEATARRVDAEVKAIVTDGTLTFGIRKAAKTNNDWTLFDSFRLTYYGELGTDELAQELAAKAAEAKDLATDLDGLVPTAYVDELTGYAAPTCSTVEEYNAAINAVNELINKANSAKEVLAETFFPTTDYANQVLELFPNGAADALEKAIEEATAATLASTEPAVWAAQAEAVNAAVKAYYEGCDKVMDGDGVTNFNVTLLVMQNPGFEDTENPLAGWNGFTPDVSLGWAQVISTAHYQPTFDFYQDVTVPNGLYSASVQEHANIGDKTNLYLQSSNQRQEVKMNWNTQVPNREDWDEALDLNRATTGNVLVTDGKVRIGVNMHTANQNQALYFDNFRLVRVSDGLNEVKALYEALKTEAEGLDEGSLSAGVKKALDDALALPVTNASEYYTAYDALRKAMDYKEAASELASDMEALLAACQGYLDYSTSNEEDSKALTAAMEEAEGYENLTTAEAVTAAYDKLADAARSFVTVAAPTQEQGFDVTILYLENPDVTGMTKAAVSSFGWVSCTNSWSNNFNNNNDPSQFYESYQSGGGFAAGTWVLYQTVNLPAGNYKMTLQAFGQNANGAGSFDGETPIGLKASVYAGDVKGDAVADGKTLDNVYSVSFAQASLKDVQLGMRADEGNGANWMGCNNMKLYKMQNEVVELDEANAYSVTSDTYADVTMARKLGAGKWNTFCVPFDMTAEQLVANGITKVVELAVDPASTNESVNLTSEEVTEVKAGVPYLVQVAQDVTEISVDGVYVTAAAPAAQTIGTAGDYTVAMTGNYSATTVPTDAFFISDNTFYVADAEAEVALKGFRAYITLTNAAGETVEANVRSISIDGGTAGDGTTAIEAVAGEAADQVVDVYTLSGVKVKGGVKASEALDGLQRGVYIVNGKKIIK